MFAGGPANELGPAAATVLVLESTWPFGKMTAAQVGWPIWTRCACPSAQKSFPSLEPFAVLSAASTHVNPSSSRRRPAPSDCTILRVGDSPRRPFVPPGHVPTAELPGLVDGSPEAKTK